MSVRKVEIRSRQVALDRVASNLAAQLNDGAEELLGFEEGELNDTEKQRLNWAADYIRERLRKIAGNDEKEVF